VVVGSGRHGGGGGRRGAVRLGFCGGGVWARRGSGGRWSELGECESGASGRVTRGRCVRPCGRLEIWKGGKVAMAGW
jgi:hypothetical protein